MNERRDKVAVAIRVARNSLLEVEMAASWAWNSGEEVEAVKDALVESEALRSKLSEILGRLDNEDDPKAEGSE